MKSPQLPEATSANWGEPVQQRCTVDLFVTKLGHSNFASSESVLHLGDSLDYVQQAQLVNITTDKFEVEQRA